MTLTGNKLLSAAIILAASQLAYAEEITPPALTTFEAGTPAKAAEVNSNFEGLKAYGEELYSLVNLSNSEQNTVITTQATLIETLEARISQLESQLEDGGFDIAVYGDGQIIGYTNHIPDIGGRGRMIVNTSLGKVDLSYQPASESGDDNSIYKLGYFEDTTNIRDYNNGNYFTDSNCTEPNRVVKVEIDAIPSLSLITTTPGIIAESRVIPDVTYQNTTSYVIEAGSQITTVENLYQPDYSNPDECVPTNNNDENTFKVVPIVELSQELHGLKATYNTISIEGYTLN